MPKVQFILAIYKRQPVGNFEFVAEEAYQKAYLPFINVLERRQSIKITLHYTGILYEIPGILWTAIKFHGDCK